MENVVNNDSPYLLMDANESFYIFYLKFDSKENGGTKYDVVPIEQYLKTLRIF